MSLSYVVVILDTSIVNVALQSIAHGLSGGVAGLQWVVNAYTLTFASLLLTGGTLGDRFGARHVYIAGLALFTCASALCGIAPRLDTLIAARIGQGIGAALLVPASMTLINLTWSDPRDRATAFGWWAGLGGVAMAAGPLVGGVLIGIAGWRSIFLVNVPICVLGIALTVRVTPPPHIAGKRPFDIAGQLAGCAALALLNLAVIDAPTLGLHSIALLACVSAAVAASAAFIGIEAHRTHPMLPLALFRQPVFSAAALVSMVSAFTFYGLAFDLGLTLQQRLGLTPWQTGLAFLPLTIVVPIGSLLAKRAVEWLGATRLVVGACLLAACGYVGLASLGPVATYVQLALPLPAIGLAASLITPATTAALMASVPPQQTGIAAGVLNAARQTGAALGVAVTGALIATPTVAGAGTHAGQWLAGALSGLAALVWWRATRQPQLATS